MIKYLFLFSRCGEYTMDVIARTAFSIELDTQKNPNSPFVLYAKKLFQPTSFIRPVLLIFSKNIYHVLCNPFIFTNIHIYARLHMYLCSFINIYIHMLSHTTHTSTHTYTHTLTLKHTHVHTHTYTQTHSHSHTQNVYFDLIMHSCVRACIFMCIL